MDMIQFAKSVVTDKINQKIDLYMKGRMENNGDTVIEIETVGELTFATSHTKIAGSDMQIYGMYCFGDHGYQLHFMDQNVIDADKFKTIQDVKVRSRNLFNHLSKLMNDL
jgi:hypothetical protein